MTAPLMCLTIRQPWAWSIINGGKDVENRSWLADYRGPLAIHVSAFRNWRAIGGCLEWIQQHVPLARIPSREELELSLGCIVGIVDVVDCVRHSSSKWATPDDWHWVLKNPNRVRPVPYKGRLRLFPCPTELEIIG